MTAQSVHFVSCLFVVLVVSQFGYRGRISVLIVPVPGHSLLFTCYLSICNSSYLRSGFWFCLCLFLVIASMRPN